MSTNSLFINLRSLYKTMNAVYIPYLKDKARYFICYGGAGSGKSHFIAQKWLFRIVLGYMTGKKHKVLALRKTQPAVRRSVFALFQTYITRWRLNSLCKVNKQEMTITFSNGSEILCMGLDDPEKIKSIEGVTGIWVEEATEFTEEDITQLDLRLRGKTDSYKQIILSFNPISIESWIKARFFDAIVQNCTILKTTYRDNRFLDDEYISVLENIPDEMLKQIYKEGEWGILKGLIYTNWEVVKEFPDFVKQTRYGLDFGYNHPSALIKCGIYDRDYLFIDEIVYQRELTNPQLIETIKNEIGVPSEDVVCDCAEPDRIQEFFNAGFNAYGCKKGKDSVRFGISKVKSFKKIYITERSVNVIKEIKQYKWKEDKNGKALDEPVDFMDDAMAAIRYAVGDAEQPDLKITLV